MDIVIIAQYLRNISDFTTNNSRFVYLANMLCQQGEDVEIITSNFSHSKKAKFESIDQNTKFNLTAIDEPGYTKNVSLDRIYSHHVLAKNIKKYLKTRRKADVIYCAVPSLSVASSVSKFCKKNNIKFIVDIQDLWPEAFKMVFNIPFISDMIFLPMTIQANRIYSKANGIIAVSQTYIDRALKNNSKKINTYSAYLGTDRNAFINSSNLEYKKNQNEFIVAYCGSLSVSYDLKLVIDAINNLSEKENVKFLIMGAGERKEEFEQYAKEKGIRYEFTGFLPYNEMINKLLICDVAVNPIVKGSAASVINKVGDYAMSGLPVINTQECEEYRKLLNEYNAGINCDTVEEITVGLDKLIHDIDYRKNMASQSALLGKEKFDRNITYAKICEIIKNIL